MRAVIVRSAATRLCAAPRRRSRRRSRRSRRGNFRRLAARVNSQPRAPRHARSGNMVPALQIRHRHVEPVRDSFQAVSPLHAVTHHPRHDRNRRHVQQKTRRHRRVRLQMVGDFQRRHRHPVSAAPHRKASRLPRPYAAARTSTCLRAPAGCSPGSARSIPAGSFNSNPGSARRHRAQQLRVQQPQVVQIRPVASATRCRSTG